MKLRSITYSGLFAVLVLFQNCGTKKNTFIHRGYHNLTARFNGYYWSSEAIKDGVFKIENANKDNYDKILPVYVVATNEGAKTTFPEFDKAIKKSSLVIQRHTIKTKQDVEIPTAGKWIDNNWINIGISRFYKREFFSGIEAFDYVVRTYKTKDKYKALLWEAKALNEIGSVSQSDPIIGLLANDKKLPKKIKSQIPALKGDYFIRRGLYKEAITVLTDASNQKGVLRKGLRHKDRARYAFIVAQLHEEQKEIKLARQYYAKAISLKPAYDMVFYANIKLARLTDTKHGNAEKTKVKLLKMTKDTKNAEYLDVVYYTLGEIEEKERHVDKAIGYYKKSAQSSVNNVNQKALAYLKIGEINFDEFNYPEAEAYYDSTISVLPKDHPNYNNIVSRKNTLTTLIGYVKIIQREDSLQRLAKMSESDRNKAIDKMIEKIADDEEKQREQLEALKAQNQNPLNSANSNLPNESLTGGPGNFYFYNQTTLSFGVSDFAKKWGNRKNEDNWRRSQKGLTIDNPTDNSVTTNSAGINVKVPTKDKTKDPRKTREYYLKQLPLTDTLMKISHAKIIEADYLLGSTYKEELNNNKRSIAAFEDLNNRYADHKYRLSAYYQLYRTYLAENNMERSDYYKNKLISDYPNSEYVKLIKNPKYAEERNAERSEVEKFYESTFELYSEKKYDQAIANCNEAFTKYGKTDFSAKFEFLKMLSIGYSKGPDSLIFALNDFLILYPTSEVTPRANEILLAIKKNNNPAMFKSGNDSINKTAVDTFKITLDEQHFALIIAPDDPKIVNPFKTAIDNFNSVYYSNKNFSIVSNLFATAQQMILVKAFDDAKEAYAYIENLKNDPKIYTGTIKKEAFTFLIISADNLPLFYKKANINSYTAFFNEAYKTVIQQPK